MRFLEELSLYKHTCLVQGKKRRIGGWNLGIGPPPGPVPGELVQGSPLLRPHGFIFCNLFICAPISVNVVCSVCRLLD